MRGTENIIAHIRSDAKTQADGILAEAEKQCAGIRQDYELKAREAYTAKIREGVKLCQNKLDSVDRVGQMETRKAVLALKQEMVAQSFDRAGELLAALPEEQYVDFLAKLAAKAASTGDEELILNARDREAVGEAVVKAANKKLGGGKLTLSAETGDFKGGLILRRGAVEANCTIELLIDGCRGDMAAQLAGVLFA